MGLTAALSQTSPDKLPWKQQSRGGHRILWVLLVSGLVLLPRSVLINRAQSERSDDEYHIRRGVQFLADTFANTKKLKLNDPPLGEAITVLPLWLARCWPAAGPGAGSAIWNQRYSADTILQVIGLWKSLFLLPMMAVAFLWVQSLYGVRSAWLAVGLLLVDPTIAAHTPIPSIDVLGMEAIVIACFLIWRYFQQPGWRRLMVASFATGAAMLIKHTAVILPAVWVVFALLEWIVRPWMDGNFRQSWQEKGLLRIGAVGVSALAIALSMWMLLKFDYSKPAVFLPDPAGFQQEHPHLAALLTHKYPAGIYITSFIQAAEHANSGHLTYLFGHIDLDGHWYYFPLVATYKIPIGIGLILLCGLISLTWRRMKWEEWSILVPLVLWTVLMLNSNIDIGWRHFLPPYVFMLLGASRLLAGAIRGWIIAAWVALGLGWVDTLRFHPDYLSYITWPRQNAWRDISDSNIDWGQGLKAISKWLRNHARGKKVYVHSYNWRPQMVYVQKRLGPHVTIGNPDKPRLPKSGIVIVSPVSLVSDYEIGDTFHVLRQRKPIAVIGHALFVYDLDRLRHGKPFGWDLQPSSQPSRLRDVDSE